MIDPKANVSSHKPPLPKVELNKPREDDGFHHDGRIALPRWECDRIWQHVVDMSQPSAPQPKAVEIRDEAVRLGAAEFDAGWE